LNLFNKISLTSLDSLSYRHKMSPTGLNATVALIISRMLYLLRYLFKIGC